MELLTLCFVPGEGFVHNNCPGGGGGGVEDEIDSHIKKCVS